MTIINLRLSAGERDELDTAARAKGITRSDLIRQSLKSYLAPRSASKASLLADPWENFAGEIVETHKAALKDMIERLDDTSWAASVERLYQIFRRKTVEATLGYQNPSPAPSAAYIAAGSSSPVASARREASLPETSMMTPRSASLGRIIT